jgi:hypothetical protein
MAFELANKFEAHQELLLTFTDHIKALKTQALTTDLHLEAYMPL